MTNRMISFTGKGGVGIPPEPKPLAYYRNILRLLELQYADDLRKYAPKTEGK